MQKEYQSAGQSQSEIYVSMFASATSTKAQTVTLASVLDGIRSGRYTAKISRLRQLLATDRARYEREKIKLPAFTVSGTALTRKKPGVHSNLLQVDLDKLGLLLVGLRERLKNDPQIAFGFVSPSGDGLKLGVTIDGTRHAESFHAAEIYFREHYGVTIDAKCKDRLRLCFVSHDPELWTKPKPLPLLLPEEISGIKETGKEDSSESCILNNCVTASLDTCISASLHNNADVIFANITAKKEALRVLSVRQPNLVRLYARVIEPRFQAQAHARNAFIVQAVPFLYRVVAPKFILELVGCFYDCNRALFNDSREQHLREAEAMLASVITTYADSLADYERKIYDGLEGVEQNAFRICRDLALLKRTDKPHGIVFMSFNELGDRLGIFPMQAQRTIRQLESYGLLKLLKKGTKRATGVPGVAGTYQWLLPLPQTPLQKREH